MLLVSHTVSDLINGIQTRQLHFNVWCYFQIKSHVYFPVASLG